VNICEITAAIGGAVILYLIVAALFLATRQR
jgi:hypothetical protein